MDFSISNIDQFTAVVGIRSLQKESEKNVQQTKVSNNDDINRQSNGDSRTQTKNDKLDISELSNPKKPNGEVLTEEETEQVNQLKARDREVRAHEQAHVSAGGGLVTSGPTYSYQTGPDGQKYAIGGEVGIDSSPVPDDPEATVRKMQQVIRAALAPAEPSGQDRAVATQAQRALAQAQAEIFTQRFGDGGEGEDGNQKVEASNLLSNIENSENNFLEVYSGNSETRSRIFDFVA